MAKISPFRPFRYAASAGPLGQVVTQPYDKITPAMRSRYLEQSPYNLVRIILGEKQPSDNATDNPYTRAQGHLEQWTASGILVQEQEPSLYAYFQEFTVPDSGERAVRKGFIGLGPVADYNEGIVHRHEQTLSGPKKDRLELLRHTQAHFGQLFMLYPDPELALDRELDAVAQGTPDGELTDEYNATHRIWKISDPARIARIQEIMDDKKLLIADGHHRYETALAYRNEHPELEDARQVMMTFVNMYSPGLKILATHRLLHNLSNWDADRFLEDAGADFEVVRLDSLAELQKKWAEPHPDKIRIGCVGQGIDGVVLLEAPREEQLDVRVLHEVLLQETLGISEEAVRDEKHVRYMRGAEAAVDEFRKGAMQVAFLLEPTSIEQVADVSFSGGVMPQKSTDFYPKLMSGLTIYKLEK